MNLGTEITMWDAEICDWLAQLDRNIRIHNRLMTETDAGSIPFIPVTVESRVDSDEVNDLWDHQRYEDIRQLYVAVWVAEGNEIADDGIFFTEEDFLTGRAQQAIMSDDGSVEE